jgi:hypothetical protein
MRKNAVITGPRPIIERVGEYLQAPSHHFVAIDEGEPAELAEKYGVQAVVSCIAAPRAPLKSYVLTCWENQWLRELLSKALGMPPATEGIAVPLLHAKLLIQQLRVLKIEGVNLSNVGSGVRLFIWVRNLGGGTSLPRTVYIFREGSAVPICIADGLPWAVGASRLEFFDLWFSVGYVDCAGGVCRPSRRVFSTWLSSSPRGAPSFRLYYLRIDLLWSIS